jgi:DnaJ like chaperone protein
MKWIGKLTGGLLGAVALGPLGALLGVLLGHQFDEHGVELLAGPSTAPGGADGGERFFRATFRVMGYLAKADGQVSEGEISAARAVMDALRLDAAQVHEAIDCFTAGKQPDFDLDAELAGLARACGGRPDLLRVFLEIEVGAALAGNNLEGPVRPLLELAHIEAVLRIQRGGFRGAEARASGPGGRDRALEEAYRVLETTPGASNTEVVKAYRRQLNRHHPDKLKANGLPDSMLAYAKQRTQQIIEAYELIRERRGLT